MADHLPVAAAELCKDGFARFKSGAFSAPHFAASFHKKRGRFGRLRKAFITGINNVLVILHLRPRLVDTVVVLGLESPHATIMFGLRREVLEGRAIEPDEVLAGLDAVTVEDLERVAAEILGGSLRLAVIGPFDDPVRFERLLAA